MISLLEITFQLSAVLLFVCAIFYYRQFKKVKRERKLTPVEQSMYILTQIAVFLCAASALLLFLDRNFG